MEMQLFRNATMKINYHNQCFLTDPYFAEKFSLPSYTGKSKNPKVDLPVAINKIVAGVEMVLISHLHSDHFDSAAQAVLDKNIFILCQPNNDKKIEMQFQNVCAIQDSYQWKDVSIKRTSGQHGTGTVLEIMGETSGFLLSAVDEPTVYWVGDSILSDEVRAFLLEEKPDIVITHSSGAVWGDQVKIVMDEVDTVEVCKLLPQSIVIAIHMDALDHATVTREQLRTYARENGVQDDQLIILNDGERYCYVK